MRHYSQIVPRDFDLGPNFEVVKYNIIGSPLGENPLNDTVNWSSWHVFWAHERRVPWSSPESNYGHARRLFFNRVSIPDEQIHAADVSLSPSESGLVMGHHYPIVPKDFDLGPNFEIIRGNCIGLASCHPMANVAEISSGCCPPNKRTVQV